MQKKNELVTVYSFEVLRTRYVKTGYFFDTNMKELQNSRQLHELEYCCNHCNTLERQLKHLKEDYAHLKANAGKINEVIEELKHLKDNHAHLKDNHAHLKDNCAQIREENALLKKENMSIKKTISALAAKGINAKTNTSDKPREKTSRSKHQRCSRSSSEQVLVTRRLLIRQIVTYAAKNSQSQLIHTVEQWST